MQFKLLAKFRQLALHNADISLQQHAHIAVQLDKFTPGVLDGLSTGWGNFKQILDLYRCGQCTNFGQFNLTVFICFSLFQFDILLPAG